MAAKASKKIESRSKSVRDLPLKAAHATSVKGGKAPKVVKSCATGVHLKEVTITG